MNPQTYQLIPVVLLATLLTLGSYLVWTLTRERALSWPRRKRSR